MAAPSWGFCFYIYIDGRILEITPDMVMGGRASPRAAHVAKQEPLLTITSLMPTSSAKIRPVSTAITSTSRAPREKGIFLPAKF